MKKLMLLVILLAILISGCSVAPVVGLSDEPGLNADNILTMEDFDLYDALIMRFMDAEPSGLNLKQRTVAALITFDAEMMNDGLCQFFVNDYNGYAQYVNDALEEVGALEMQAHYSDFVDENEIDVTNMDSFRITSIQDYGKQFERYPYEAFDSTFSEIYQRENLSDFLLSYVRLYAEEIID